MHEKAREALIAREKSPLERDFTTACLAYHEVRWEQPDQLDSNDQYSAEQLDRITHALMIIIYCADKKASRRRNQDLEPELAWTPEVRRRFRRLGLYIGNERIFGELTKTVDAIYLQREAYQEMQTLRQEKDPDYWDAARLLGELATSS